MNVVGRGWTGNAVVCCAKRLFSVSERDNAEFMSRQIEADWKVFQLASSRLRNDGHFVRWAVKQNGMVLKDVGSSLIEDPEIVFVAAFHDPRVLRYTSTTLGKWCEHFKEFQGEFTKALGNRTLSMKSDADWGKNLGLFSLRVFQKGFPVGGSLSDQEEILRSTLVEYGAAFETDGRFIPTTEKMWQCTLPSDRGNQDYMLRAVERSAAVALKYASDELKKNPDVVRAAIRKDPSALWYSPLGNDKSFVQPEALLNPDVIKYIGSELRSRL